MAAAMSHVCSTGTVNYIKDGRLQICVTTHFHHIVNSNISTDTTTGEYWRQFLSIGPPPGTAWFLRSQPTQKPKQPTAQSVSADLYATSNYLVFPKH